MANLKASKKSTLTSEKNRVENVARRSALKTAIRKVEEALQNKDTGVAQELMRTAESVIARAKGKGVLKPHTASRKISKLAKKVAVQVIGK